MRAAWEYVFAYCLAHARCILRVGRAAPTCIRVCVGALAIAFSNAQVPLRGGGEEVRRVRQTHGLVQVAVTERARGRVHTFRPRALTTKGQHVYSRAQPLTRARARARTHTHTHTHTHIRAPRCRTAAVARRRHRAPGTSNRPHARVNTISCDRGGMWTIVLRQKAGVYLFSLWCVCAS